MLGFKLNEKNKYVYKNLKVEKDKIYYENNTMLRDIDWCKYKIGDAIYYKNQNGIGLCKKPFIIWSFCIKCKRPNNKIDSKCDTCLISEGNGVASSCNNGYNICGNCKNIFKYIHENHLYCKNCIIFENRYSQNKDIKIYQSPTLEDYKIMKIGDKYTYNDISNNTVTRNFKGLCGHCGEQPIENNTYCRSCKKYFGKEYLYNIEKKKNKSKGLFDIDVEYGNIVDNLVFRACEQDKSLKDKKVLDILYKRYNDKNICKIDAIDRIDTINIASNLGYDDIVNEMYMNFVEMMAGNFEIDCNNINKIPKLNTKIKFKLGIADISVGIYALKVKIIKYKKIKNKFYKNINEFYDTCNKNKEEHKKRMELFDAIEKEVEEDIKKEKEEQQNIQIKKLFEKLKENKNRKIKEDNNICKLINKLQNQKVDKLYILSDIGKELKDKNIENETDFLEQFKDNDIYYIYDLKSKNKTSRFINMCKKLHLLKDEINLENIISNNLLTSIRDLSQNNFIHLLNLF